VANPFTWDVGVQAGLPLLLQEQGGAAAYIYGPGGMLLESVQGTSATDVHYYHQDRLGSVRALTNSTGQVEATYEYDAYGKLLSSTGSVYNPFGYTGEYTDSESGLIYLRARYYDPTTQQFLTVDPELAWTEQAYAYVAGSPTNFGDATGLAVDCGPFERCYSGGGSSAGSWDDTDASALGPQFKGSVGCPDYQMDVGTISGYGMDCQPMGSYIAYILWTTSFFGHDFGPAMGPEGRGGSGRGNSEGTAVGGGRLLGPGEVCYRGGNSLIARDIDISINKQTGLLNPSRGISVNLSPAGKCQDSGHAITSVVLNALRPSLSRRNRQALGSYQQELQDTKPLPEHSALFSQCDPFFRLHAVSKIVSRLIVG
jgi:RHS repeat-associated protein